MSCRARRVPALDGQALEALAWSGPFVELARADRRDDFGWLAQSQGIPAEAVEEFWRAMRARASGAPDPGR